MLYLTVFIHDKNLKTCILLTKEFLKIVFDKNKIREFRNYPSTVGLGRKMIKSKIHLLPKLSVVLALIDDQID